MDGVRLLIAQDESEQETRLNSGLTALISGDADGIAFEPNVWAGRRSDRATNLYLQHALAWLHTDLSHFYALTNPTNTTRNNTITSVPG